MTTRNAVTPSRKQLTSQLGSPPSHRLGKKLTSQLGNELLSNPMSLMRLRQSPWVRDLCSQTDFNLRQLVQPLFFSDCVKQDESIHGMKGILRHSREGLLRQIESDLEQGVRHFILFPVPGVKADSNFQLEKVCEILLQTKNRFKSAFTMWVDTCLCSFTTHGHCGITNVNSMEGTFDLGATCSELSRFALCYAQAGADGVSPSDMMDGRTAAIRKKLDESGHSQTMLMSYSTKFSSCFYGPFRGAANSTPQFGDRKLYQIDVRHRDDAIRASQRCAEEGADLLMVKPGMTSIDLIGPISQLTRLPVGAYQVSGEYISMMLLAENGLVNFESALEESWFVFKRAGAQYIITYGARLARKMGFN